MPVFVVEMMFGVKNEPDELLHKGVAVVGGVRTAVAVKYGEVQHVVVYPGDAEAVLVLLPKAQNGR